MSTSTKPYMIRALYEWCTDNGHTPFLVVWVDEHTDVPLEFVKNNEIVLNIAAGATHNLRIDHEWVSFSARFGGVSRDLWIPVGNVLSIFARETGEGMGFEVEPAASRSQGPVLAAVEDASGEEGDASSGHSPEEPPPQRPGGRPSLRIVK
ncbi:ClpXP protease specificity-enhancing factor [uncultured Aquitalea sp.]|uniref:ClpXP protease specificity-enhancing factor n=1 Tax=uncultured Aquitalea sp. TaxID=540272 RepID=UPI0025E114D8|nr:ClpXP protease specificity-enhancing factor [uncultured Aquitalea sp.]